MANVTYVANEAAMKRVFAVDNEGNSQAPEQFHGGNINYADFGDNPVLKRASETLDFGGRGLAAIDNLRAKPHPEDTPARHARKVREAEASYGPAWAPKWDGAKAELQAEQRRVEAELERAANLKPNEKHFNAIVGTFSGLTPGERAQTLAQLIAEADGPVLATLIEAPTLVSGLTGEQRDSIKLRLFEAVNPQGLALRDALTRALAKMEAASITGLRVRAQLLEGCDRFDQRAKEAEELANKAHSGFAA